MNFIVVLPIGVKLFLSTVVLIGPILIGLLLSLLRRMLDQQVSNQFEKWASAAKIPKSIKGLIGFEVKWR